MSDNKYLQAIRDVQRLLTELLNDPEHGELTFKGMGGLDDLTITGPEKLNNLSSGAVLSIDDDEWLALSHQMGKPRQWQCYLEGRRMASKELYIHALDNADELYYIHDGYTVGADL